MRSLNNLPTMLVIAGMATFPSFAAWAQNELPDPEQQSSINFMTGGIGDEETHAMEAIKDDYNLRITSADKTGHFSGKPHIITDMQHNELLSADAGPLFYADMPVGRYIIEGSNKGESKSQNIVVTDKKNTAVRFTWQAHPDDSTAY